MMSKHVMKRCRCVLMALLVLLPWMGLKASSVMVWPIDPVLKAGERASALWLENRGGNPVLLQLRIFAWTDHAGEEQYRPQSAIIGSPPMIRIAPGKKQLVRLIKTVEPPAGQELAYRIVIDEIPAPEPAASLQAGKSALGVHFQMRYLVPLFVYGQGLIPPQEKARRASQAKPALGWKPVTVGGRPYIELSNRGPVHARLTELAFVEGGQRRVVDSGLFGYVLAGSTVRLPLRNIAIPAGSVLQAVVNGAQPPQAIVKHP